MKPDIIKDEILDVLESLKEQIPVLINYKDKIPQIELDIVLDNIRKLYEDINDLKRCEKPGEGENKPESITEKKKEEKTEEPDSSMIVDENKENLSNEERATEGDKSEQIVEEEIVRTEDKIEDKTEEVLEIKEEIKSEVEEEEEEKEVPEDIIIEGEKETTEKVVEKPLREPVKIVFETKEEEIIAPKKRKIQEKAEIDLFSTSEPRLADKFKDQSTSINEKIVDNKEDKSIAAKMQKEKINDLKLAIGLNDKFLFINELFNGDMQAYSEAIEKINQQNSFEETRIILDDLNKKYNWNTQQDTYEKLLSLVERKFKNA